jgi:protein gp37
MENSKIEWTHHTFNPWIGCTKVSDGCKYCYAENLMDTRWNKVQWGPQGERKMTSPANWRQPFAWNKAAAKTGSRARVFCASLADVFEDNPQVMEYRRLLCEMIELTRNLDWLLLTKRPENVNRMIERATGRYADAWFADCRHVWVGTSVEDLDAADTRIPELVKVPAAVRFLSCEPLLGPVTFRPKAYSWGQVLQAVALGKSDMYAEPAMLSGIHWVIVGGESGPNARPMDPDWAKHLRDQCKQAGVPFFMKQMGSAWAKANGLTGKADNLAQIPPNLRFREFPQPQKVDAL